MADADQNQNHAGPSGSARPSGRGHLQEAKLSRKNYIGSRTEGINNRSYEAYSPRAKTVDLVIDALDELGAVIIRAPPASGKTSLLQLVHEKLRSMGSQVYYIPLGQYDPKTTPFDAIWAQHYPDVDFSNLVASPQSSPESNSKPAPPPKPIYVLADEAQKAFADTDLAFFGKLKDVQRGDSKVQLRILLVSCWGSNRFRISTTSYSTPGSWDNANTIGLWLKEDPASGLGVALQFTQEEAEEYWADWLRANGWSSYATDAERKFLFLATQRQPGALSLVLDRIKELGLQPSRVNEAEWHEKVQRWLLSEDLVKAVYDLRSMNILATAFQEGIPGAAAGLSIPVEAIKDLIRKMLKTPDLKVHTSELIPFPMEQSAALTLTRLGQLLLENEYFKLPSFLHVRYIARQLYMGRNLGADSILRGGIFEFISVVVERMDPSQLKLAASRNTLEGPPYERLYQNLFFLSAMSYLPHNAILSPDVGYLYGAQGYLDFQLGYPFWWGFELLREGDKRQEHLNRFDGQGKYAQLLTSGVVKEWAVIDFCWKTKPVAALQGALVQVSFSEGYETACIRASGKEKRVRLRGLSSL
eukprot:TRINITY_DN334_c0_g1_i1.p1 TRINITY_DN334_c0_g1~~TRINITY_DN334_c0_g1_i1.p1  ORF type:complete len:631 (-),score=111.49 TRINITY_DN334_c0_g1_i1:315-2072(-)